MHDFLKWQSSLSLDQVFSSADTFSYPASAHGCDGFFYLTQLKHDKSRSALMFSDGLDTQCVTPSPFSLRTKISEYGGKPYWLFDGELFFCNQTDQCLYRQTFLSTQSTLEFSKPQRISPKGSDHLTYMYSDVIKVSESVLLVIVECEDLSSDAENKSYLATIDLNDAEKTPTIIQQGADFYSNLVFSAKSRTVAWVEWQHPQMPWDANRLYTAKLSIEKGHVAIEDQRHMELADSASVCQLMFANNNKLFFSADFNNQRNADNRVTDYWNVYCWDFEQASLLQVTNEAIEFGYPHWQYGDSRIVQLDDNRLLTVGSAPSGDQLFLIDQTTLNVTPLSKTRSTIQSLHSQADGSALMIELPSNEGARLIRLNNFELNEFEPQVLIENKTPLATENVSMPEHIAFNGRDGGQVYGFYYPPVNCDYDAESNACPPPLIVMVHGGPTARAYGHFDVQKQFWTSRGFALFDVNHRGSSGYGRAYRDALYQNWGDADCDDIVDGISYLISQGKADEQRICIRGKSAGGYAVLRALTEYPDVFKAGACYYGIGNLATLAQTTHKFEKHYADRLIGEPYDAEQASLPESRFFQRSPIHKVSQLKSAMIVFQGLKDKVVPPEVAHEVVSALKESGVDHEYVEYQDEAHGFRQVENNIDAWTKELAFYRRILAN